MKLKAWLSTITLCALIIIILGFVKWSEISDAIEFAQSMPEYSETVDAIKAEPTTYTETMSVIGNIIIPQHITLKNEFSGKVKQVNFLSGASVKQGDAIIKLDIAHETANLKSALASAQLAKSIYLRAQDLRTSNAISNEQFDQALSQQKITQAAVDVLRNTIAKKTITAPFDGHLGIHSIKVGQYLDKMSIITSITGRKDTVWVDFFVPQFYQPLKLNQQVTLSQIATSTTNSSSMAQIIAIDDVVTSNVRSRKYRAQLSNTTAQFSENTAVSVLVPVAPTVHSTRVPNISVLRDLSGNYVYKLIKDQAGNLRAHRQTVTIIASGSQYSIIGGELAPNDLIAAPGAYKLFDGVLTNIAKVIDNTPPTQLAGG